MTYLVVGATGATGRLLVRELLERGEDVRAIVRDAARLDESLRGHSKLSVVEGSISQMTDAEVRALVAGSEAAASCLGHNLSFRDSSGRRIAWSLGRRGGSATRLAPRALAMANLDVSSS